MWQKKCLTGKQGYWKSSGNCVVDPERYIPQTICYASEHIKIFNCTIKKERKKEKN